MRIRVHPIKKKLDVLAMFKEFKEKLKLESEKKIKCFRTDNGGEYVADDFLTFCKQVAVKTGYYVKNRSQSTAIVLKTPMEIWKELRGIVCMIPLPAR
ncbi:hypothetical protein AHAS_Ahas14G0018600 [Arachis hypogaea]